MYFVMNDSTIVLQAIKIVTNKTILYSYQWHQDVKRKTYNT